MRRERSRKSASQKYLFKLSSPSSASFSFVVQFILVLRSFLSLDEEEEFLPSEVLLELGGVGNDCSLLANVGYLEIQKNELISLLRTCRSILWRDVNLQGIFSHSFVLTCNSKNVPILIILPGRSFDNEMNIC